MAALFARKRTRLLGVEVCMKFRGLLPLLLSLVVVGPGCSSSDGLLYDFDGDGVALNLPIAGCDIFGYRVDAS